MHCKLGKHIIVGRTSRTTMKGIKCLHRAFSAYPLIIIDYDDITNHPSYIQYQQPHTNNTTLPLHLKSMCSMGGDNHILLGGTPYSSIIQQLIQRPKPNLILQPLKSDLHTPKDSDSDSSSDNDYIFTHLPYEVSAANVLYINNTIIRRTSDEFPLSEAIFRSAQFSGSGTSATTTQIQVEASELAKVDGALTCCSLLLKY